VTGRSAIGLLSVAILALPVWAVVTARRLNRYEYNASVRDLLGVDFRPADDFPADNFSYGFDNNAATLTVTPSLAAKYPQAARRIAGRCLSSRDWRSISAGPTATVRAITRVPRPPT
jgi:hypothetical protein